MYNLLARLSTFIGLFETYFFRKLEEDYSERYNFDTQRVYTDISRDCVDLPSMVE